MLRLWGRARTFFEKARDVKVHSDREDRNFETLLCYLTSLSSYSYSVESEY